MKLDEALAIIERFFLDVIGTVFAGALFLFLIGYFFALPFPGNVLATQNSVVAFLLLGASYALGHVLTYFGGALVEPAFRHGCGWLYADFGRAADRQQAKAECEGDNFSAKWSREFRRILTNALGWTDDHQRSAGTSLDDATAKSLVQVLRDRGYLKDSHPLKSFNELRNLALSIEGVDKQLVYRFQFLGLFNLTTAAALTIAVGLWSVYHLVEWITVHVVPPPHGSFAFHPLEFSWLYPAAAGLVAIALLERSARFHGISMRVPISEALMKLQRPEPAALKRREVASSPKVPRVYLAGGFRSGWQDQVRSHFAGRIEFIDPRRHGLESMQNYTAWDLRGVESADLVFAYLESSNPGGYALALEVGYGKGLGKVIIYAEEPDATTEGRGRYLEMVRAASSYCCKSLDEAIKLLDELIAQKLM